VAEDRAAKDRSTLTTLHAAVPGSSTQITNGIDAPLRDSLRASHAHCQGVPAEMLSGVSFLIIYLNPEPEYGEHLTRDRRV
jgi:hypothetical protein